jgi:replication factor A1
MFEEGNVYYLSKARVTMARKQFSTLDNEYELTLEAGTEIELVSKLRYSLTKLIKHLSSVLLMLLFLK